jgi:NAD(P)-dependent dehydrogenase (short-subunit alcohol dehydrogenase family)
MGSIAWAEAMKLAAGSAYKVSKAGLHMLNKQYALDLKDEGFTCLLISPGVSLQAKHGSRNPHDTNPSHIVAQDNHRHRLW